MALPCLKRGPPEANAERSVPFSVLVSLEKTKISQQYETHRLTVKWDQLSIDTTTVCMCVGLLTLALSPSA